MFSNTLAPSDANKKTCAEFISRTWQQTADDRRYDSLRLPSFSENPPPGDRNKVSHVLLTLPNYSMASYHRQNQHANKRKVSISYVIREGEERCHRAGINSLQYDPQLDRLYSAGRDSVIRIWGFDNSPDLNNTGLGARANNASGNIRSSNGYEKSSSSGGSNSSSGRPHQHAKEDDCFVRSMEHHTDWVNDIALCCDGRNLISVSNDTTIKVWNAHQGFCLSTLRSHKDYAKCLSYAKDREIVASAGFDRMIYLWDIQALTMLTATKNTVTTKPLDGSKNSIYSLAINQSGTLVASGSTEKVIRLWDPRTRQKLLKLRGHTDNVRSLVLSKDASMLLSASSDGTIRLWSIGQQRCVSIIRAHDEGVWTLQTNESFTTVYSGGKDCKIFMTDLRNTSDSMLVCEEKAPISRILLVNRSHSSSSNHSSYNQSDSCSLWVSTTDSTIRNWSINSKDIECAKARQDRASLEKEGIFDIPIDSKPNLIIRGNPAVINYQILNDRRHILTLESDNSVALYDVLTARKVANLHPAGDSQSARQLYEEEIKKRFKMVYVPNWFTVDLKIGLLCIHLEESECLSAWVSARDYGFSPNIDGQDLKVNLGCLMLQALFEYWPQTYEGFDNEPRSLTNETISDSANLDDIYSSRTNQLARQRAVALDRGLSNGLGQRVGNQYFSIDSHTPIIISEGNQTILRFLAYEAANEIEDTIIQEILPPWIGDIVMCRSHPKFTKVIII